MSWHTMWIILSRLPFFGGNVNRIVFISNKTFSGLLKYSQLLNLWVLICELFTLMNCAQLLRGKIQLLWNVRNFCETLTTFVKYSQLLWTFKLWETLKTMVLWSVHKLCEIFSISMRCLQSLWNIHNFSGLSSFGKL